LDLGEPRINVGTINQLKKGVFTVFEINISVKIQDIETVPLKTNPG
jgi:hypothetical protein